MVTQLLLSSTTKTAVNHLLAQIRDVRGAEILTPVNILLPTTGVIHGLRGKLGDTVGVQMYQFYHLGHAVLDDAGIPIHEIDDTAIRRLIRRILGELNAENQLTSFTPVWEKPGFVEVILEWVRELKSQGIFPEKYDEYAKGNGREQDRQLAEFYLRYQTFMQARNYSDADGLLWVTAEVLEEDPALFRRDGPLYVLGFDQFTPVQIRILRQLADRFNELNIYLHWDERRSEDSLALVRLRRTQDSLLENIPMEISIIPEERDSNDLLWHLHSNIFEPTRSQPMDKQFLQLIEAPSREAEVRWALREVKRLILEGVLPSNIAILAKNTHAYLPIIHTVSTEYGLPIEYEHPLLGNPAVVALVNLLKLPPSFPWHYTFEALRSPYIRQSWLSEEQIELLEQLSRERPVVAGRDQWLFAVRPLKLDTLDKEDEDLGPPPLVATLSPEALTEIEDGLTGFFDHLTPPKKATYREYIWWIQTVIIGYFPEGEGDEESPDNIPTLDLLGCCQESSFRVRDLEALDLVMQGLRRLLASTETVPDEVEISWEVFRDDVLNLLGVMQIPPDSSQADVRFGQLEGGRARIVDHLFVLGLSEGEFPTPPPADALYTPHERENHPLPLIRFSPADDASLWWQVIGNVGKKIVLLRPYIDANGAPWQSSPYWDALCACVEDFEVERLPIAAHPGPDNAASIAELLNAFAQNGAKKVPEIVESQWVYAQHAEAIMRQRQSFRPPGDYEGILGSDKIKDELHERFGTRHVWSASRLNRYANCPYGFFVEQVLKLEAHQDPEEGMDVMQRGSLLHAALERLYQRLTETGTRPTKSNKEIILQYLEEGWAKIFPSAPQRYGFRPGALWAYEQEELRRLLRSFVSWECEVNDPEARFLPYLQEVQFGIGEGGPPPLGIDGEQAQFRLRGVIDRIDRDSAGNLRVIDYKSGSTQYYTSDLQKGLALQTALYALAAEKFWLIEEGRVAESHYWLIPSRSSSGSLKFSDSVREDDLAERVIQQASWSVGLVRSGIFPSAPAKPIQGRLTCSRNCNYGHICRVTRHSIAKAKQGGLV